MENHLEDWKIETTVCHDEKECTEASLVIEL
jgi:hypothetical protein